MNIVEANKVTKKFGGLSAITDVDFHIAKDEIVGLIGPNGAGKTTFFNLLTGLYTPTSGEIKINNEIINGLKSYQIAKRGLSRTFQNIRLFGNISVIENVMMSRYLKSKAGIWSSIIRPKWVKKEEKEIREISRSFLKFVGMESYENEVAKNLSYGNQRRLEIARALACEPELLLLDEPTAGMNMEETKNVMKLIHSIRDNKIAILVIEHNMSLVMNVSDRIVVLDHGIKIDDGKPEEVANNPKVIEAYLGKEI